MNFVYCFIPGTKLKFQLVKFSNFLYFQKKFSVTTTVKGRKQFTETCILNKIIKNFKIIYILQKWKCVYLCDNNKAFIKKFKYFLCARKEE